jgi:hypothetical protein
MIGIAVLLSNKASGIFVGILVSMDSCRDVDSRLAALPKQHHEFVFFIF